MRIFFLWVVLFNLVLFGGESKSLAIFTYKVYGAAPWDPSSIHKGLTGSEEAVVYLSEKLSRLGYQVTVFGDPPPHSPYSSNEANPRYVDVSYNDGTIYDYAISWRIPFNASLLKTRAKKVYLWPHDIYFGPELTKEQVHTFDDVMWLSEWQRTQWLQKNPAFETFTHICGNGINPEQFPLLQEKKNPHACIYASNYARGLSVLLDVWPNIKKEFPDATLDIYYGWQHWGLLTQEAEASLRKKVLELAPLDVQEHGCVSHEELNLAYAKASVWAYPCTDTEVFCITGLKAQLSGVLPAIIKTAALHETVPNGLSCDIVTSYQETLLKALKASESLSLKERKKMGDFILENHTWEKVAGRFDSIFQNKPLIETTLIKNEEECPHCIYFLAKTLLHKGEKKAALSALDKRISMNGDLSELYHAALQKAHLLKELDYSPAEIIKAYQTALTHNPQAALPQFCLAELHTQEGNHSLSYEILEKINPSSKMEAWKLERLLGLNCFQLEKYNDAIAYFEKVLSSTTATINVKNESEYYIKLAQGKEKKESDEKKVLLAILARNKGHVLPMFLDCIDNLEYDKKQITLYINTNNNCDNTVELLEKWMNKNKHRYNDVIYENHELELDNSAPHAWTEGRVKQLAKIRAKSMQQAKEKNCDYYFVADVDNFLLPCTLKELIKKDKPIIAPMLRAIPDPSDHYTNFFYDTSENGYFKDHPNFMKILNREMVGTFKVPLVHCTYLVNTKYIDQLMYDDGTNSHEFVIFSRTARKNKIDQYICNEKEFGVIWIFFEDPDKLTLEHEKRAFNNFLEMHRGLKTMGLL